MSVPTTTSRIDLTREVAFTLGALQVNPATREVSLGEKREILEPRVMQVLTALARHRGEIVTREELIAACWENRSVGDDAINRCIGRLRRLSEALGNFTLETIPRVGHRLTAETETTAADPPPQTSWFSAAPPWHVLVVAALIAAAGLIAWVVHPQADIKTVPTVRQTIAVLPFSPLSANAQMYGDRVASAVAEALSKMGEPMVPTTESFQYRGPTKARAARELRVMYVIDGEVVRENGKVRVSLHFDDAQRGTTIFSHMFEEPEGRAEALPDRVAGYIASMTWGADITLWSKDKGPGLLRILDLQKRSENFSAYEAARAMSAAHPNDPDIQSTLAWSLANLVAADPSLRSADRIAEIRRAADRERRLNPGTGNPYAIYAWTTPNVLWRERDDYLRKALAITPGAVGILMQQTWMLDEEGYARDAFAGARSAYDRFPYHEISAQRLIEQQLAAGNDASARSLLKQARRLWPENSTLLNLGFEATAFQNAPSDADAFLNDSAVSPYLSDDRPAIWKAIVRALKSRRKDDIDAMARSCNTAREAWWSCIVAYAKLGRLDAAYNIANGAYPDQRAASREAVEKKWLSRPEVPPMRYLFIPATARMRADPRFRDLVERVGLLQYWQSMHRPPDFCGAEPAPVCALIK